MAKIPAYLLNLAGEYHVCSELNKRGVFATVTYGNHKGVDVYAISQRHGRALKIEVKTGQRANFVTGISQKCGDDDPHSEGFWLRRESDSAAPDFWVLYQVRPGHDEKFQERFFVLTHQEICRAQRATNELYIAKYAERHGGATPDMRKGVDNVPLAIVEQFEDRWSKLIDRLDGPISE